MTEPSLPIHRAETDLNSNLPILLEMFHCALEQHLLPLLRKRDRRLSTAQQRLHAHIDILTG